MRPVAAEAAPPPPPRPDGSFDTNMVVILAALLTALLCALGLNSIVRCALRCGWRGGADAPKGMGRRALRQMPVSEYDGPGGAECPICLGEFRAGEKVRVLPRCSHAFHPRCIDTWIEAHASCPTCRQCLVERREKPPPPQLARELMVGSFVI